MLSQSEEFLDTLQRAAFTYFLENVNPSNGLIADTTRSHSPSSIAVTGLGLTSYTVGVERGWLTRTDGAARALVTLKFLWNASAGEQDGMSGYKGFYYHFLDMQTGIRVWGCELSMIDTALLMAGVLAVGAYFSGTNAEEKNIREFSEKLINYG